jgi:hypothetical protein
MGVMLPPIVAPELVMPALAVVPERFPLRAAIGGIPAHLALGLPRMALSVMAPVMASVGGCGA